MTAGVSGVALLPGGLIPVSHDWCWAPRLYGRRQAPPGRIDPRPPPHGCTVWCYLDSGIAWRHIAGGRPAAAPGNLAGDRAFWGVDHLGSEPFRTPASGVPAPLPGCGRNRPAVPLRIRVSEDRRHRARGSYPARRERTAANSEALQSSGVAQSARQSAIPAGSPVDPPGRTLPGCRNRPEEEASPSSGAGGAVPTSAARAAGADPMSIVGSGHS